MQIAVLPWPNSLRSRHKIMETLYWRVAYIYEFGGAGNWPALRPTLEDEDVALAQIEQLHTYKHNYTQ